MKNNLCRASGMLAAVFLATALAVAGEDGRNVYVLTSTNDASANSVVVFKLSGGSLSWVDTLPTGGKGGASGNAGILQFEDQLGAVANFGSNTVSQLERDDDYISVGRTINLKAGCVNPDSVALSEGKFFGPFGGHLYVVGTNCAESHAWPAGKLDGAVVSLPDNTAAQIAVGKSWGAVTLKSGYVLQLGLTGAGDLNGTSTSVTLPVVADNTPFGEAFWGDILGFTPAHSTVDTFAIVDASRNVYPISGLSYPANAPCWVAKGPGNLWYTGNSPAMEISIFFSDGQGGAYNKSTSALPGPVTDLTVSSDFKWLAVIYTAGGEGYIAVYSIDAYGDLTYVATSPASADLPASISGVAFSE